MKRKGSTLRFLIPCLCLLLGTSAAYSQVKKITGVVTNAVDKNPIQGITVTIKGSSTGVVTDESGRYSISIPRSSSTLLFSYVGYASQEFVAGNKTTINVSMINEDKEMSEVIVTAFGVKREKRSVAYTTQTVDGSKLIEARESNVVNSLKGKVAGVHVNPSSGGPAGSSHVVIRGSSSLTGNNQPLYVVDGVPIDNQTLGVPTLFGSQRDYGDGIGNINPDDIETLNVLKGPAAASLYGARGAHGVILITTKKGKAGRMTIDVNSNATFDKLNAIPTYQNKYGGGYDGDYLSFGTENVNGEQVSVWPGWLLDNWGGPYDGRKVLFETWPELGPVSYTAKNGDNFRNFYRTGSTLTNTIGVSGGTDKGSYRLSVSDLHNKGIVPNNKFDRQTVNLVVSMKPTSNLTVEAKANYVRQHQDNPPETGGSNSAAHSGITRMPLFLDMDWLKTYKRPDGSMINYKSGSPMNPYWTMEELLATGDRDRMIGYILAKYQFTSWLSLQARTGTDFYNDTRFQRIGIGSSNEFDGSVTNNEFKVKEDNSDLLLNANGNLSKNFTGSISVGANHLKRTTSSLSTQGTGFYIPNLYTVGNSKFVTASSYSTAREMNSVYFDAQAGYKSVLYIGVTGRNDWSSTLGKDNYSFFYPSVNTSFIFTDALGISSPIFSFGKIRASYAQAGNDAAPYLTKGGYEISSSTYNGQPFANISNAIPLSDLKNELTRSVEFGTELRFFNNRLSLDLTYYDASTINQITPVQISAGTGFQSRLVNAGEIRNKGIEIFASGSPIHTANFRWDVSLNFSKNKSKVVTLAPGLETLVLMDTYNGATIEARPGEPYGNIIGLAYLRNDAGQIVLGDAGTWQPAEKPSVLGNVQPDWLGGITNTFSYKGFDLSALIDIRQGGEVFSFSKYNQTASGTGKFTENRENLIPDGYILQPDGKYTKSTIAITPQQYYPEGGPWSGINEPMILNADYVSMREARLSYNFGTLPFIKSSILKALKVSIVGRNLFYIYRDPVFKSMGASPETAFNTTTAAQGIETPAIPTTRNLGFNLSFSF